MRNLTITVSMKKWIYRLFNSDWHLTTYQSRVAGAEAWKIHGWYFMNGPNHANTRSPVRGMIERMEGLGLIVWQEKSVSLQGRREVRCLQAVLTEKANAIAKANSRSNDVPG